MERAAAASGVGLLEGVSNAVQERVIEQEEAVEELLGLLTGGHVLRKSRPGLWGAIATWCPSD